MRLRELTLVVPFFEAPRMLAKQIDAWLHYPAGIKVIVVDDCSKQAALPLLLDAKREMGEDLRLYRINTDLAWNRHGVRNLASQEAETQWLLHVDTDHILPPESAHALIGSEVDPARWYRFPRWRVGKADETRMKDNLPRDCEFGRVKPHGDSYLCTREQFWRVGGYDEDFVGSLGGGTPFLAQMEDDSPIELLPYEICLHVHTRSSVADSSVSTLSRDTSRYSSLRKEKERTGKTKAVNPIRFSWERQL